MAEVWFNGQAFEVVIISLNTMPNSLLHGCSDLFLKNNACELSCFVYALSDQCVSHYGNNNWYRYAENV